jgi:hypothetical protein
VTDGFDGTGRQNAPKSGQIALLWKWQQKAFRLSRDVPSEPSGRGSAPGQGEFASSGLLICGIEVLPGAPHGGAILIQDGAVVDSDFVIPAGLVLERHFAVPDASRYSRLTATGTTEFLTVLVDRTFTACWMSAEVLLVLEGPRAGEVGRRQTQSERQ